MLTYHQWSSAVIIWRQFHRKCSEYIDMSLKIMNLGLQLHLPEVDEINTRFCSVVFSIYTITVGQRKKVTAVTFFRCPTVTISTLWQHLRCCRNSPEHVFDTFPRRWHRHDFGSQRALCRRCALTSKLTPTREHVSDPCPCLIMSVSNTFTAYEHVLVFSALCIR